MSHTEIHQLNLGPITTHSFNKDRTQVAICPNNNEVQIFGKTGNNWILSHTLLEHDKLVTSIDWAPESNRIVSCSQDRNAYVWNFDPTSGNWKPTLVLLRIDRAATFVRWSPKENKFAVASGARCIAICYFEEGHDWWVSKLLKKPIRSTVLSIDWHPNNVLLAAGSADFKARVFSAYIKGVDQKPPSSVWGDKLPFNTVCGEFTNGNGGWIHSVAFSPSGDALAFTGHDSQMSIVYPANNTQKDIRVATLPYLSLLWVTEHKIIATGYDCVPVLYETKDGETWQLSKVLDSGKKKVVGEATAFSRFRQMDVLGINTEISGLHDTHLNTIHQNTITLIRSYRGSQEVTHFSTSSVDGKLTTIGSGISVIKKVKKKLLSDSTMVDFSSRKKHKDGLLKEPIKVVGISASDAFSSLVKGISRDITESESIDIEEEYLQKSGEKSGGNNTKITPKSSKKVVTKHTLGKFFSTIDFSIENNDDDNILNRSFFLSPSLSLKHMVQILVRKFFALNIDLVVAFFTSEKAMMTTAKLANNHGIVVNTNLKHPINNHTNWAIVLKKIPVETSVKAVHTTVAEFKTIKSIKIQLIDTVRMARTDIDKQTWDFKNEFRALLYTLFMSTTAHDI
ncbi:hypothetical protein G9A89_010712 [Geosiphon pyriformis]|nr:hypothetical protein G9A89_010712 [Geosiphon pyriformis]